PGLSAACHGREAVAAGVPVVLNEGVAPAVVGTAVVSAARGRAGLARTRATRARTHDETAQCGEDGQGSGSLKAHEGPQRAVPADFRPRKLHRETGKRAFLYTL